MKLKLCDCKIVNYISNTDILSVQNIFEYIKDFSFQINFDCDTNA